jgi:tight adherence protein C
MNTSHLEDRSTWSDRKLFSGFHGILKEEAGSLTAPQPEELPQDPEQMVFGSLTPSLAELIPESQERKETQRRNLTAAGYQSRSAWLNLNATRFVLAFLAVVIVGFWLLLAPPALEPWLLGALIAGPLLGWALPPLFVSSRASERTIDIERGLPDVMDMLNMGVSQGLTIPAAFGRIAKEIRPSHPALAAELEIVNRQTALGSLSQALRNFSNRIDSAEVSSFTSLLMQSESTGTSIAKTLTEYSDSMRSTLRERADSRANAASFKLLFPVALCLMPSVFLFLLGPAIVEMSNFFNSTASELLDDRDEALNTLDQQPVVVPQDG